MTSRLRRMILINTRTGGTTCSGSISEINPQGGAAITGKNAAGKTTTLQLVPLFFGIAPSQISQSSANREPVLRFVLPNPTSAIAFEYQRGDDPHDVKLVILRRQHGTDTPEYRILESAFLTDLFVREIDGGQLEFLDDAGTRDAALKRHIAPGTRFSSAQYRSIILNLRSYNKDFADIKRAAQQFSFAKKELPHMDRLVATMVRERVDFSDFTAVVTTMVLDQMGGLSPVGGAGQKIIVRQGKEQIARWLRNRDACERALKIKPEVDALEALLKTRRKVDHELRASRADVHQLNKLLLAHIDGLQKDIDTNASDWGTLCPQMQERTADYETRHATLTHDLSVLQSTYDAALSLKNYFITHEAQRWSQELQLLPAKQATKRQIDAQILNMQGAAEGISRQFELEIAQLKQHTAETINGLTKGKATHQVRFNAESAELESQQRQALAAHKAKCGTASQELQLDIDKALEHLGLARANKANPKVGQGYKDRLQKSIAAYSTHQTNLVEVTRTFGRHQLDMANGQRKLDAALQHVSGCNNDLIALKAELEKAHALLAPPVGTLHHDLLQAQDQSWQIDLARIIDPALLKRSDLKPIHLVESSSSLFGWVVDLAVLSDPPWNNAQHIRSQVEQGKIKLAAAIQHLEDANAACMAAAAALEPIKTAVDNSRAELSILEGKTAGLKLAVAENQEDFNNAKAKAIADASIDETVRIAEVQRLQAQAKDLHSSHSRGESAILEEFAIAKAQAYERCIKADEKIDGQVRAYSEEQTLAVAALTREKLRQMGEKGVDVQQIVHLSGKSRLLGEVINSLTEQAPMVERWTEWVNTGPARLTDMSIQLDEQKTDLKTLGLDLAKAKDDFLATQSKFSTERAKLISSFNGVQDELDLLERMDQELSEYPPGSDSQITTETAAKRLRADQVVPLLAEMNQLDSSIETNRRLIEQQLCTHESAVKDFVLATLDDLAPSSTLPQRAQRLINAHDQIGRQVTTQVNVELNTILDHLRQFRNRVATFESEVRSFNKRLQTGLNEVVVGFERLGEFKVAVITDFDKIDFIGKLTALDDVTRQHHEIHRATYSLEVPPASTAYALQDFMSVISAGTLEVDLAQHIHLSGTINDGGNIKPFTCDKELASISSTGVTALAMITLLSGLLNVIRGVSPIHIPWITDEVGRFDPGNFKSLMDMLRANHIDVVTASPSLTPAALGHFSQRYLFGPNGSIAIYKNANRLAA